MRAARSSFATKTPAAPRSAPGLAALILSLALVACGGGDGGPQDGAQGADVEPSAGEAGSAAAAIQPVKGPLDETLASRGEALFRDLGCTACHRVDERLVGPALKGVTSRRDYPWFYHMVTNPDSMIRNDSIGKALLAEYLTPMANQNVSDDEARALFEYFRSVDESADARSAAGSSAGDADDGEDS